MNEGKWTKLMRERMTVAPEIILVAVLGVEKWKLGREKHNYNSCYTRFRSFFLWMRFCFILRCA